jgi:hypothetical protein
MVAVAVAVAGYIHHCWAPYPRVVWDYTNLLGVESCQMDLKNTAAEPADARTSAVLGEGAASQGHNQMEEQLHYHGTVKA